MSVDEIILYSQWVVVGLSLSVFVFLLRNGAFSERQLRLGPTRDLHESAWVYAAAIAGVMLYSVLMIGLSRSGIVEVLLGIELIKFAIIGLMVGRARLADAGFRKIGLLPRWPVRDCVWGLVGGVVALGLAGAVGMALSYISQLLGHPVDQVGHEALQTLRDEFSVELLINLIISAVILAPLTEELLFRGVFQTSLLRVFKGARWPALLIASVIFALLHISVVTSWQSLVPLFVLGLVFGYLYERTGSLITPILAHAVFNAANIAIALNLPD